MPLFVLMIGSSGVLGFVGAGHMPPTQDQGVLGALLLPDVFGLVGFLAAVGGVVYMAISIAAAIHRRPALHNEAPLQHSSQQLE